MLRTIDAITAHAMTQIPYLFVVTRVLVCQIHCVYDNYTNEIVIAKTSWEKTFDNTHANTQPTELWKLDRLFCGVSGAFVYFCWLSEASCVFLWWKQVAAEGFMTIKMSAINVQTVDEPKEIQPETGAIRIQ